MRVDDGESGDDNVPVCMRVYACRHLDVCLFGHLYVRVCVCMSVPVRVRGCVYGFYEILVCY